MAKVSHFEQPLGPINGVNMIFVTSTAYVLGSVVVFLRGIPRVAAWDDGWFETDPAAGTITLKEPPCLGDDVQIMWCEETPDAVESAVEPLHGVLTDADVVITGTLTDEQSLSACIQASAEGLCGTIEDMSIKGFISPSATIYGIIQECK